MKVQVAKCDLEDALQVVSNSLNTSGTDISGHFVFLYQEDKLKVYTFSGRLFSECPVTAVVEDTENVNAFSVEGSRLLQWTRAARDAALTIAFDAESKVVTATSPRGSMEFESLDPQSFPFWDAMWADVEEKATLPSERLEYALKYARSFCFDKETKRPDLCLVECQKGMLYSTDGKAITLVELEGLDESSLRIHRNDAGAILKFLQTCKGSDVVLMEHPRSLLFKRNDGAVFGESRFDAQYPNLVVDRDSDASVWWELPLDEITEAIPYLASGSAKEDYRLFFNREGDGPVQIGMKAMTGAQMDIDIAVVDSGGTDVSTFPEEGFVINSEDLNKVLGHWDGPTVKFSLHVKGSKGYVRLRQERDEVDCTTILAWLRA